MFGRAVFEVTEVRGGRMVKKRDFEAGKQVVHVWLFLQGKYDRNYHHTANIFKVIFTVFNCVRLSTVVSLYGLHLIAAPITIK